MYSVLYEDQIWSIHRNKWSQLSYLLCTDHGMISYLLHTDHGWLQYLLVVWCNLLCHWTRTEVDMLLQRIYIYQNVSWCSWILCCDTIYLWKCFTNILHAYIFVLKLYIINTWLKIKIVMIMSSMTIVITFRWTASILLEQKYVKNVMSTIKYTCIQKCLNSK